uniref:Uncharacterized protein n=1 Tax=Globodera pallida TaxID=36090 RepID=A0A183C481_GLOPA
MPPPISHMDNPSFNSPPHPRHNGAYGACRRRHGTYCWQAKCQLYMKQHCYVRPSGGGGNQPPQMQAGTLGLPVGNSIGTYNMAQPQQQQSQSVAQHPQLQQQFPSMKQQQQAISSPTGNMSFDMNTFFAATQQQQQPMTNVGNQSQR